MRLKTRKEMLNILHSSAGSCELKPQQHIAEHKLARFRLKRLTIPSISEDAE